MKRAFNNIVFIFPSPLPSGSRDAAELMYGGFGHIYTLSNKAGS